MSSTAPTPEPPEAAASRNGLLIAILIAVSALNPIAVNMFVPAMPEIMRSLETDLTSVQLVLSGYLFATAGAQLILGPLSDRLGRRPVLLGGLAIFIIASAVCTAATSIGVLIGARVLQGIGGCAGIVLSRAIVRDRYDRDRAAAMLGYVTMGFAVAPMLAPTIGGVLNDLVGWRSIFAVQTVAGVIVAFAAWRALPETRKEVDPSIERAGFLAGLGVMVRIPRFWAYTGTIAFGVAVFFSFLGGTPFIANELLGMSGTEFGLHFAFGPGGFILGNFITARFSPRLGLYTMVVAGSLLALFAAAAMGIAFGLGYYHPLSLFLPLFFIGLANGMTFANAIAGSVSIRPDLAGTASGLAGSLQILFGAIATVLVGALEGETRSVFPMIGLMLFFATVALGCAVWTRYART